MKLVDRSGKEINVKIHKYLAKKKGRSKSKFQSEIKQDLFKDYPHDLIYEEVLIPKENFVLDFFIPSVSIVVECHGRQHTEHVKFFHKTKRDFNDQVHRDIKKREWCEINNLRLIEIYC